jgi:hypothetical protein
MKKKDHMVQVIVGGERYVAVELNNVVTVSRDGDVLGKAIWKEDQLLHSTAVLADPVFEALEKKIRERVANNWDED